MRTMILALAVVLLAAPVWAGVTITFNWTSNTECEIGYETDGEIVRAFALDVTATDGNVVDVNEFVVGDDNNGYGIFPKNFSRYITVNTQTGEVDDWDMAGYSPVAEAGDIGALGGLDTDGVTLEMGALYDTNQPGTTGKLCKVVVTDGTSEICVTGNAIRGNVVLEDTTEVEMPETCSAAPGDEECFPNDHPKYNEWVAVGKPPCWCLKRQCYGDADGHKEGSSKTGFFYSKYNDLAVLLAGWPIAEPTKGPGIATVTAGLYNTPGICADFARDQEGSSKTGYFRVKYNDLGILVGSWNIAEPTKGPGLGTDCGGDYEDYTELP
jgi:hypothetical protein